jgi:predicted GIY-YIG superfamily endonuclease
MTYTIYALVDPRDYRFYCVGSTQNLKRRQHEHLHGGSFGKVLLRYKELRACDNKPMMVTMETQPDMQSALKAERRVIARLMELGYTLLNNRVPQAGRQART